jgi:Leucine-rich repeat (LRR) protein
MNKQLNQLGETLNFLHQIEEIILKINNKKRSKKLEIIKLEILNEIKKLDKSLIETKKH